MMWLSHVELCTQPHVMAITCGYHMWLSHVERAAMPGCRAHRRAPTPAAQVGGGELRTKWAPAGGAGGLDHATRRVDLLRVSTVECSAVNLNTGAVFA